MSAGVSRGGPTPWWQVDRQSGAAYQNLQNSAPAGYYYDPVAMHYTRTPASLGADKASAQSAYMNGISPSMSALFSQFGGAFGGVGGSGGGFGGGTGGTGGGSTSSIPNVQAPDMTAANNAIFSQAKDRAGSLARSALNSLNGELGANGGGSMIGSGAQAQASQNIIENGAGMLENTNNEMAKNDAAMKADFAKLGYQGQITQRGQDIQQQEANAQLSLAQQDRYMKMIQTLMSMFGGGSFSY